MAKETKRSADVWLPSDFFYGDFFVQSHNNLHQLNNKNPLSAKFQEPSYIEEGYMSILTRRMATSLLQDDASVDTLRYSVPDNGATRNKIAPNNSGRASLAVPAAKNVGNSVITHRQVQATQFNRLRQQQLMKQQVASGQGIPSKMKASRGQNGRPLGFSPTMQTKGSQMRAVFTRNEKKECAGTGVFLPGTVGVCAGTGVFLPRTIGVKEGKKKVGCSTVLVPERVLKALNLNLEEFGDLPRVSDGYVFDHDALIGRSNGVQRTNSYDHQSYHHGNVSGVAGCEIGLPKEWGF